MSLMVICRVPSLARVVGGQRSKRLVFLLNEVERTLFVAGQRIERGMSLDLPLSRRRNKVGLPVLCDIRGPKRV